MGGLGIVVPFVSLQSWDTKLAYHRSYPGVEPLRGPDQKMTAVDFREGQFGGEEGGRTGGTEGQGRNMGLFLLQP